MTCPCCGYCTACGRTYPRPWGWPVVVPKPYVPITPYQPYWGTVGMATRQAQAFLGG